MRISGELIRGYDGIPTLRGREALEEKLKLFAGNTVSMP